ncbi:FIMAH domain-containing protein [Lentibacillus kapialis]
MIDMVERFEAEGAFSDDEAVRALKMHLTAVKRFEQDDSADKVAKHIEGFKLLLNQQLENEAISEDAYDALMAKTKSMMGQWG